MTKVIALAGKGGTGKTTTSALLLKYLIARNLTPVLAVDADANANLNELLDLEVQTTLGVIRKELKGELPPGMTRDQYMEMKIHQALIEDSGFDLLVMGQPDGPGCYCAANHMIREIMDRIGGGYDYVVMDNEAGMEHISRRTTRDVDHLLLVTDMSQRGMIAAQRIIDMVPGLENNVMNMHLIINRVPGEQLPPALADAAAKLDIELIGTLPNDTVMSEYEFSGRPLVTLPQDTPVVRAVYEIADKLF